MKTPIQKALEAYLQKDMARFHMPGHKGAPLDLLGPVLPYDVTEVLGTDSLYDASECIRESEREYERLDGSRRTLISAGGSTLCIQTMLALAAPAGSTILAGRNIHVSAVNAMGLLDLRPQWIFPQQNPGGVGSVILPRDVEQALAQNPEIRAVYLTSPDYFGVMSDLKTIGEICRRFSAPLLVDTAHGAHFAFLEENLHPMALGATACCDSLHKTLPVITGGALLHLADERMAQNAKQAMSMFGTTSPSYLIMLSVDRVLDYIQGDLREDLKKTGDMVKELRQLAASKGFFIPPQRCDPTRLTLGIAQAGFDRERFGKLLRAHGMEPEYLSDTGCVLLLSVFNREKDMDRLWRMLRSLPDREPAFVDIPKVERPVCSALTLRQALLGEREELEVSQLEGRICACVKSPCPPGIPLAVPGEKLEKNMLILMKKYGIDTLYVVK